MTRESKKHSAVYFLYESEAERVKKFNMFMDEIFDKYESLEQRNAELEQRITELEVQLADAETYFDGVHTELETPKTCEGCKWLHSGVYREPCQYCMRDSQSDYYEPKGK